jgi:hypothetical protein
MSVFSRSVSRVLILCLTLAGMPMPVTAGMVTTDRIYAGAERGQVADFLERAEVRSRMQALGVDPDIARARVDALSDGEVAALAEQIERLPAGGADIVGALLLVFIILLITDILGLTKVFPFTRSVR